MSDHTQVAEPREFSEKWEFSFKFVAARSELHEGFINSLPRSGRLDEEVFGREPFMWIAYLATVAAICFRMYVHADPHGRVKKSEVQQSNALWIVAILIDVVCLTIAIIRRIKKRTRDLAEEQFLRIGQSGISDGRTGKCLRRWAEISEFIEAASTYLVLKRAKDYVLVPKRIMDTAAQANFAQHCRREIAKNHIRKTQVTALAGKKEAKSGRK